jgi:hypothetical protein
VPIGKETLRTNSVRVFADRFRAPVFVLGSARSGTTLLYDTLLSAGGFALYLGESNIFNLLAPRFGDLGIRRNRERMLEVWLGSRLFRVSGLERRQIENKILGTCTSAGDFLRIVMNEIAVQQGAWRWAANSPEEILYLPLIKETIPEALIIHVIRDGRDVALSLSQKRYIRPFPWRDRETPEGAAIYWEWIVERGRAAGAKLGDDYTEVRFEELVNHPRMVLGHLSSFLGQELDYDFIQKNAIGSVARPNTSFKAESAAEFNPVGRWKRHLSSIQVTKIESLVGKTLAQLGYPLATSCGLAHNSQTAGCTRLIYRRFFELKVRWKNNPLLRMLRPSLTAAEVDRTVIVDDQGSANVRPHWQTRDWKVTDSRSKGLPRL